MPGTPWRRGAESSFAEMDVIAVIMIFALIVLLMIVISIQQNKRLSRSAENVTRD